jgi:hypothetical protein
MVKGAFIQLQHLCMLVCAKALFASCTVSLCPTTELFYSSIEQGSDDLNYRRNTLNTLFRPRITSLCHDVCDTLMSRFSALAVCAPACMRVLNMALRYVHASMTAAYAA